MYELIQELTRAGKKLTATLQHLGGRAAAALHNGLRRLRQLATDTQPPLDPLLEENAPRLPGTGNRAFWIGLIFVSLSLVSGLATYLILTGLTPIVPRNEVVLGVLFINVLLALAMVVVITVQAVACTAPGGRRWPARACMPGSSPCSASSRRCRPCCSRSRPPPPSPAPSTTGSTVRRRRSS